MCVHMLKLINLYTLHLSRVLKEKLERSKEERKEKIKGKERKQNLKLL